MSGKRAGSHRVPKTTPPDPRSQSTRGSLDTCWTTLKELADLRRSGEVSHNAFLRLLRLWHRDAEPKFAVALLSFVSSSEGKLEFYSCEFDESFAVNAQVCVESKLDKSCEILPSGGRFEILAAAPHRGLSHIKTLNLFRNIKFSIISNHYSFNDKTESLLLSWIVTETAEQHHGSTKMTADAENSSLVYVGQDKSPPSYEGAALTNVSTLSDYSGVAPGAQQDKRGEEVGDIPSLDISGPTIERRKLSSVEVDARLDQAEQRNSKLRQGQLDELRSLLDDLEGTSKGTYEANKADAARVMKLVEDAEAVLLFSGRGKKGFEYQNHPCTIRCEFDVTDSFQLRTAAKASTYIGSVEVWPRFIVTSREAMPEFGNP